MHTGPHPAGNNTPEESDGAAQRPPRRVYREVYTRVCLLLPHPGIPTTLPPWVYLSSLPASWCTEHCYGGVQAAARLREEALGSVLRNSLGERTLGFSGSQEYQERYASLRRVTPLFRRAFG